MLCCAVLSCLELGSKRVQVGIVYFYSSFFLFLRGNINVQRCLFFYVSIYLCTYKINVVDLHALYSNLVNQRKEEKRKKKRGGMGILRWEKGRRDDII